MGERLEYYNRRLKALNTPEDYVCDISDGMAGSKTVVPSCADAYEFKPNLKLHVRQTCLVFILNLIFFINRLKECCSTADALICTEHLKTYHVEVMLLLTVGY